MPWNGVADLLFYCNILILIVTLVVWFLGHLVHLKLRTMQQALASFSASNIGLPAAQPSWWNRNKRPWNVTSESRKPAHPVLVTWASGRVGSIHDWKCRRRRCWGWTQMCQVSHELTLKTPEITIFAFKSKRLFFFFFFLKIQTWCMHV